MRILLFFFIIIYLNGCSFDNKSGIWENDNIGKKKTSYLKDFKILNSTSTKFNKIISIDDSFTFKLPKQIINSGWEDIFYNKTNNFINFKYDNQNKLLLKSKKMTRHKININTLIENNNLIVNDKKGNITIYYLNNKKIVKKFNFYKKKFKDLEKKLNLIVENNIIFVSDNLGYLYAFDYEKNDILWAKDYKIPFRSNLKIYKNKLIAANQNNDIYFLNKVNGDLIKMLPTEETLLKNQFVNNLSLSDNNLLFLNTAGSLYSLNCDNMQMRWFINLNQTLDLNSGNLFNSNQIITDKKKLVVSSNDHLYVVDIETGIILSKYNFVSIVKPLILNDYLFLISKNNLLISLDLSKNQIIYSYDIRKKISDFYNKEKKKVIFRNILAANNQLLVFLKNSHVLKFGVDGNLNDVIKLPTNIYSNPMIANNLLYYLDNKNKLSIIN
tara:strand:+ start:2315 stop:3637 length:1323 start_codon:yes stop_codon:yes gene_type:complete